MPGLAGVPNATRISDGTSRPRRPARSIAPWALLVAAFALYEVAYVALYLARPHAPSDPAFGDFYAFWSFAHFAHMPPVERIYDLATIEAYQRGLMQGFVGFYPYPYPPIFLLYLWPLGWLGYLPAYGVWIAVTLGLYLAAVAGGVARGAWRTPRIWFAMVAPTTLFSIVFGQNGLLTAALMIGGFRLLARFPLLGGAILGGLAYKPQMFVLVPVVLLAARQWRALCGLATSVVGLAIASAVAFGPEIWVRWIGATPALWRVFEQNRPALNHMLPTVTASLLGAGVSPGAAQMTQVAVSLGVIACLGVLFHRGAKSGGAPRALDVAALQVGVFLATPYAFVYDMPIVTSAVAITIERCTRAGRSWRPGEAMVLLLALLLPVLLLSGGAAGWPVGPVILTLLLALVVRAGWAMPADERAIEPRSSTRGVGTDRAIASHAARSGGDDGLPALEPRGSA